MKILQRWLIANWAVLTKQLNYHEGITYDANGNILRYQRNGDNSAKQVMDNMTYAYDYFTAMVQEKPTTRRSQYQQMRQG